ncbi:MAG: hypothetical protein PHI28_10345 [Mangrovibacterium sp.]|nr:hypothetical protein [Mangrovibacterium sp.]
MKALVLESYHHFEYKEVEAPVPAGDEVLTRVKAAGICGIISRSGFRCSRIPEWLWTGGFLMANS